MVPHKSSLLVVIPLEMIMNKFNNKYGQRQSDLQNPILPVNDSNKYIILQ